jgi:arginase
MDLGAGRRGVDMGPSAMRIGRLQERIEELGLLVEDAGNVGVRIAEQVPHEKHSHYLREIGQVCSELAARVRQALEGGCRPLVLGGDHSIAVGSVAGASSYFHARDQRLGLIWVDAHTDINVPETSPSGNLHGMPLAALLGLGPPQLVDIEGFSPKVVAANTVVVGARDVDGGERDLIRRLGLRVISMKEIDMRGMTAVMEEALAIATDGTVGFHCSFDLDVVDPNFAPGVGTPVPGGITYRESHLAMEMIYDSGLCASLEMVEVNPVLDSENRTGRLAVVLACSALGKKIL